MDNNFNGSNIEFEAPTNPYTNVGFKSMQAIIDMADEDRIILKRKYKTLQITEGSPRTEYLSTLWYNRSVLFRQ